MSAATINGDQRFGNGNAMEESVTRLLNIDSSSRQESYALTGLFLKSHKL
jgi:hypothetical protein